MRVVAAIVLCLALAVLGAYPLGYSLVLSRTYNANVSAYMTMADDASTAKLKLEYLNQYRGAVKKYVTGEESVYFWKTPQNKVSTQLRVLDSLVHRIEQTAAMPEGSLEYQQAMAQITGQEFETTLGTTNNVFYEAYIRQDGVWRYLMANGGCGVAVAVLVGLLVIPFTWLSIVG